MARYLYDLELVPPTGRHIDEADIERIIVDILALDTVLAIEVQPLSAVRDGRIQTAFLISYEDYEPVRDPETDRYSAPPSPAHDPYTTVMKVAKIVESHPGWRTGDSGGFQVYPEINSFADFHAAIEAEA